MAQTDARPSLSREAFCSQTLESENVPALLFLYSFLVLILLTLCTCSFWSGLQSLIYYVSPYSTAAITFWLHCSAGTQTFQARGCTHAAQGGTALQTISRFGSKLVGAPTQQTDLHNLALSLELHCLLQSPKSQCASSRQDRKEDSYSR